MSKTFLLGAGLTDLGGFGRYLGPKQGKSKCFRRTREIHWRAYIGIKVIDIVVLVKDFNFSHFLFRKNPLSSVEILSPEANLSSSHKTKTTSFRRCGIAEPDAARDFLLKTGLKSDFGSV